MVLLGAGGEDEDHTPVQGVTVLLSASQTALEVEVLLEEVVEAMQTMCMGLPAGADVRDSSIPTCEREPRYPSYYTKTDPS